MTAPEPLFNLRTTDNKPDHEICIAAAEDLLPLANKNLLEVVNAHPGLLVFPEKMGSHEDGMGKQSLFDLKDNLLSTANVMGFLGVNKTRLIIASRFQRGPADKDHFMHYLLQKVFALNLFELNVETGAEDIWDILLIYLFSYYLNKAINQGLYKTYKKEEHNDANLRGRVDIARHLKRNIPFLGKIAYQTREHSFDNPVTQLIRHTITYINSHQFSGSLLSGQAETRLSVNQIIQATPCFDRKDTLKVMNANLKKIVHPYYTAYEPLRKICLQILRREGLSYGQEDDQVYGLLFDGAWLWEEYLNLLLAPLGYRHPKNKLGKRGDPIYLFNNDTQSRFPDFYAPEKRTVIDAKYKALQQAKIEREDYHQLITYLYILEGKKGCFLYPCSAGVSAALGTLNGYGASIHSYGMEIPSGHTDYADFCRLMTASEKRLTAFFKEF